MAGLLDIFGTSGQETMGLLGMSPEDITRSRDEAQAQALYALAGRLFQGGRGASSVLEGLQQGQQAYKTAMQGGLQEQLQKAQLKEMIRKREEDEVKRQLERQALMRQQAVQTEIEKAYRPETFAETPLTNMMGLEIAGPNMPQEAGIGMEALAPKLRATKEGRAALKELQPEYKEVNGVLYEITAGMPPKLVAGTKKRDTVTVGNVVLDKDNMSVLYTAPDAPAGSIKEFQDFMKLPKNEQAAYIQLQDQKRPTTTINMPSEGERKAAVLASRLNFSVGQMNQAIGLDPKAAMPNTTAEIARFVSRTDFLPNKLTTEQRQIVEAAQEDILDAALTLGTGAAYTREQLAGYKKSYFPQLEDKPAQIKTKQERLNNLLKSAEVASGRAAGQITAPIPKLPNVSTDAGLPSADAIQAEIERRRKAGGG
jgi:hypothetical protein